MSSPRAVPAAEAIVTLRASSKVEQRSSDLPSSSQSVEDSEPSAAGVTAPPSPILLPAEDAAGFIEQFNATYGRVGLRMQLTPQGKAALVTRERETVRRENEPRS